MIFLSKNCSKFILDQSWLSYIFDQKTVLQKLWCKKLYTKNCSCSYISISPKTIHTKSKNIFVHQRSSIQYWAIFSTKKLYSKNCEAKNCIPKTVVVLIFQFLQKQFTQKAKTFFSPTFFNTTFYTSKLFFHIEIERAEFNVFLGGFRFSFVLQLDSTSITGEDADPRIRLP